jgi:predicted nucleic acid-binding protein
LGLKALRAFLQRHRRIALDSSVFIYQIEANPRYRDLTGPIFVWLNRPDCTAVTSTITMTEVLVPAYRSGGEDRVDQFYGLLTAYATLDWIAPSLEIADIAARIRATYRLRTPDALQAATAVHGRATGLITNDPVFERVAGMETLVLERLL